MSYAFSGQPPTNPVLRYMAILSAARDFGVSEEDIESVARQFDPLQARPHELADALARLVPSAPAA